MSDLRKRFVREQEFPVPPAVMWDLLSNTERLNRNIGLPSVHFSSPQIADTTNYREASATAYGWLPLKWKEHPFEWVINERYAVLREFRSGPIKSFYGGIELKPTALGTRVQVFGEFVAAGRWATPLVALMGRKGVRDTLNYCAQVLKESSQALPAATATRTADVNLERALAKLSERASLAGPLIQRLGRHLTEASDDQVLRMRPFVLADAWGAPREETLRVFLYATREGLLNLAWELMCPNCRVPKAEYTTLRELAESFHCDLCGVSYQTDLDRYTELRFSVHPEIREASDQVFCLGGPGNSPHILLQQSLEPGRECPVDITLTAESLRVRALRYNQSSDLRPRSGAASDVRLTYADEGWSMTGTEFQPGPVRFSFLNRSSKLLVAVLEKITWDERAVTAAQVTTMQEFRDLFSAEVLAPGRQIGIRSLAVLFTDLKGSTLLYETVGDASAFGRVRRHFDFLIECVERNRGTIVKTIGDAVMAAFTTTPDALRAGLEIQQGIDEFNRTHQLDPPIVIKLGFHQGPVIAVNANDRLDYFGRTVNIASRIQNESRGGDIVVARELLQTVELQRLLKENNTSVSPFEADLKDIGRAFPLCRIIPKDKG